MIDNFISNIDKLKKSLTTRQQTINKMIDDITRKHMNELLYMNRADQLYQKGQLADALKNCRGALKVTPGYEPAKEGVSYVYVKYAQNAYDQRDFDSAEIHLKEASQFYKDNPKTYILYGKIAYDKDNYDEAKQEWLKALDIDPNLDEVKILLQKISQEHRVEENFEEQKTGNFSVKFEGTEKEDLEKLVGELKESHFSKNFDKMKEDTEAITAKWNTISTRIYSQAQQPPSDDGPGDDPEVEDTDFEEVK